MSNKYSQNVLDSAKKSATHAIKSALKRAIDKTTETKGDLIENKIHEKITSVSKSPHNTSKELHSKTGENEIEIPKERYISLEKKK